MKNQLTTEDNLRRMAYRRGYKLIKYRHNSRCKDLGPYALAEIYTNTIKHARLTLKSVGEIVEELPTVRE